MISITKEMKDVLEEERKKRLLDSIPETVRMILSEHLANLAKPRDFNQVMDEIAEEQRKGQGRKH